MGREWDDRVAGSRKSNRGKNDPALIEKRRKALRLRKAGMGYESIASKVGYSNAGAAYKAVQAALKATIQEPADDVRTLEIERLDRLMLALWKLALEGESDAIDRVLKIMDRRAKLLGLDAPTKVTQHSPPAGLSSEPPIGPDGKEAAI
jgi:hypothetical protein